MSLHTIRIEQGVVTTPAQPNQNPSVAESPTQGRGESPVGLAIKMQTYVQGARQLRDSVIGQIGFASGNYELQEKADSIVKGAGIGLAFIKAPIVVGTTMAIKGASDVYVYRKNVSRLQNRQQQQQVLTGKISTNGGVWV